MYVRLKNFIRRNYLNPINQWKFDITQYKYVKNLLKTIERKNLLNYTIVHNLVRNHRINIALELFYGTLFAVNGAKVIVLFDDGVMTHWDSYQNHHLPKNEKITSFRHNRYNFNIRNYKELFKHFLEKNASKKGMKCFKTENLEYKFYSEIVDFKNLNSKKRQELKKYAKASTIKFFKTSELDFFNKDVCYYYNLSIINALISRNVGEYVLKEIKPDFFFSTHGIYSIWGPAFDYLKTNKIPSLLIHLNSHTRNHKDGYFSYNTNDQTLSQCKLWQNYKDIPVTEEMRRKVKEFFDYRISFKTKDTKIFYSKQPYIYKIDKNDGYKYHIAIFPSLIWDGNIEDRHVAFSGLLDWLNSTIDYFKNRKDVKLFLKFHPAEVTLSKSAAKIQDLIKNYLKTNEIENLIVFPTEKIIDPYPFLKSGIDFGICYDGIISLEMAYLKIPSLLGGVKGHFNIDGGNFTINNRKEYFKYLKNFDKHIEEFHKNYEEYYENIVRYLYWYCYENIINIPIFTKLGTINLLQLREKDFRINNKLLKILTLK